MLCPEQRQLRIQLLESKAWFELRVEDSGPGFPAAMQADITSAQLNSTKSGGMGIRLFVAFTATTNHNGTMQIGRSTSLGGGGVVIQLPRLLPRPGLPRSLLLALTAECCSARSHIAFDSVCCTRPSTPFLSR